MASWGSNVIRVALDQDHWLSGNVWMYDPNYTEEIDKVIAWAEAACMDVILDLHWSDQGDLTVSRSEKQGAGYSNQQPMADVNSIEFWKEVATRYRGDGRVLFELYNEPHDIPWNVWLNGGTVGTVQYAGMQQLYDTIRNDAHADNIVIAGGVQWAFDLSGVASNPLNGYNIMYASHVYKQSNDVQSEWPAKFGYLAENNVAPVILTEFGDGPQNDTCTGDWDTEVIQYANPLGISWTAWGWYVPYPTTAESLCAFPALISDWSGTPTVQGVSVKTALAAYPSVQCVQSLDDGGANDGANGTDGNGDASSVDGALDSASSDGGGADVSTADATSGDATPADGAIVDATMTTDGASDAGDGASAADATTGDDVTAEDGAPANSPTDGGDSDSIVDAGDGSSSDASTTE
jgi:hypothetical protein